MGKHRHVWQEWQAAQTSVASRRCLECGETQVLRGVSGGPAEGGIPAGLPADYLKHLKSEQGPMFDPTALVTIRDAYGIRGGFSPVPLADGSSFRNPDPRPVEVRIMREPKPEEAFQIILEHLRHIKANTTSEHFREEAGKWITKFTNGIVDIINGEGEE